MLKETETTEEKLHVYVLMEIKYYMLIIFVSNLCETYFLKYFETTLFLTARNLITELRMKLYSL